MFQECALCAGINNRKSDVVYICMKTPPSAKSFRPAIDKQLTLQGSHFIPESDASRMSPADGDKKSDSSSHRPQPTSSEVLVHKKKKVYSQNSPYRLLLTT